LLNVALLYLIATGALVRSSVKDRFSGKLHQAAKVLMPERSDTEGPKNVTNVRPSLLSVALLCLQTVEICLAHKAFCKQRSTLHVGNQLIFLQVPDESSIDHAFDHFTQATCKRYWAVTGWITFVLVNLGYRQNNCLLPSRRKRFTWPQFV